MCFKPFRRVYAYSGEVGLLLVLGGKLGRRGFCRAWESVGTGRDGGGKVVACACESELGSGESENTGDGLGTTEIPVHFYRAAACRF